MEEVDSLRTGAVIKSNPRIIFMGTPAFAVASLNAVVQAGFNVIAVITAPDRPAGRGLTLQQSAVKQYAIAHSIPVLQPEKLKQPDFLQELERLQADLQAVVAFRMLPEVVWSMPPMGTINVHGSILPQYRGAAPINWAVINGEFETGITTFKLQHAIDTGNILLQEKIKISNDETAGELHDRMMLLGAEILVKTMVSLQNGTLKETLQHTVLEGETELKHAPKIFTETCKINWKQDVDIIYNLIRGLSPFPGAFTLLNGKMFKIYRSVKLQIKPDTDAGEYETDGKSFLNFACNDGFISVKELQLEGKKRMDIVAFLRGHRF